MGYQPTGIETLRNVFVSHGHTDHIGCLHLCHVNRRLHHITTPWQIVMPETYMEPFKMVATAISSMNRGGVPPPYPPAMGKGIDGKEKGKEMGGEKEGKEERKVEKKDQAGDTVGEERKVEKKDQAADTIGEEKKDKAGDTVTKITIHSPEKHKDTSTQTDPILLPFHKLLVTEFTPAELCNNRPLYARGDGCSSSETKSVTSASSKSGGGGGIDRGKDITAYRMRHKIPSFGYIIHEHRKKLKAAYLDATGKPFDGKKLVELRKAGHVLEELYSFPLLAFTGDTSIEAILEQPKFLEAKILIMECTHFDGTIENAASHGHVHFQQFVDNIHKFKNEWIILSHLSQKYTSFSAVESYLSVLFRDHKEYASKVIVWI